MAELRRNLAACRPAVSPLYEYESIISKPPSAIRITCDPPGKPFPPLSRPDEGSFPDKFLRHSDLDTDIRTRHVQRILGRDSLIAAAAGYDEP